MKPFILFVVLLHLHGALPNHTTSEIPTEDEILCHEVQKIVHCRQSLSPGERQTNSSKTPNERIFCEGSSKLDVNTVSEELIEKCRERKQVDYVLVYTTATSSFLLSLTTFTYVCLPSLLNIHGKSILCHLANQLMSSGFQIASAVLLPKVNPLGEYDQFLSCWVVGYGLYFFTISSNAWLVVVNFDLWDTFRNKYKRDLGGERSQFMMYSLFGWGIPILAATIVGILDATLPQSSDFKPNIAIDRCFLSFQNTYSIILYFYVVIGLMLGFNFIVFAWTNVTLCSVQSKVARAKHDSHRKQVVTRIFLFFKLFCVMGITWTISFALWILGYDRIQLKDRSNIARFFQLFNVFHGFCYFAVFVCKPSIFKLIKKKFEGVSRSEDSTSSRRISTLIRGVRGANSGSSNHA